MAGESGEGSLTVNRIVGEVVDAMHGYVRDQGQVTETTTALADDGLSFKVCERDQVSRGLIEVDDELMYAKNVTSDGIVNLFTWGRGQSGTVAAAHDIGAPVRMSPLYPRQRVRDQVFATLRDIHPDIAPIGEQYIDVSPVRTNYPMPEDTYHLLRVEWHPPGPSQMWLPVKRWFQNKTATSVELELLGPAFPGQQRARVLYMKDLPDSFAADEDLAALGYPQDIHGLLVLGACYRLLTFSEPARLQVQSVTATAQGEFVPAGSMASLAKFVYGMYQQRLQELRYWYSERYPLSVKQTR